MNESSLRVVDLDPSSERLPPSEAERRELAALETASPEEILRWSLRRWGRSLAIVTSFQAEGMVLLDMAWRIDPRVRVITLDTGRLHQETYDLMDRVRERYGLSIEVFAPEASEVEGLVRRHGPNLFYRSREDRRACCRVRKVGPLARAQAGLDAWVTGLRRDQTPSRAGVAKAAREARHQAAAGHGPETIVKLCPLADWTHEQVWAYLGARSVPVHSLYARGYTSIGCQPCTRRPRPGEDPRAGRWWWEEAEPKECGLHLVPLGSGSSLSRVAGASA